MIICIKTDSKEAEIYLYEHSDKKAEYIWRADRQLARDLLRQLDSLLKANHLGWSDVDGIVVYLGPGSFTGLRIGVVTASSIAYSLVCPSVGSQGDDWIQSGIRRLESGESDDLIMPEYGADPRITAPRK